MSSHSKTVFLTGASGFLGSHIASQLLDAGYAVKASFRSKAKGQAFEKAFSGKPIQTCEVPDITASGAYTGLLDGADFVVHCASPFTFSVKDIQKDLIHPAVQGTSELLRAVGECPSVKRVVITSSFAAGVDPFKNPRPGHAYKDDEWNPVTPKQALENNLYGYQASKTFAERAAWEFQSSHPSLSLVTICPPMIFGPAHPASGITAEKPNESSAQLMSNVRATGEPGPARMPVFADVRDVAAAHVAALDVGKLPLEKSERFLVCGGKFTWKAIKEIAEHGSASVESMAQAEEYYSMDVSKVERILGIKWTPLEKCVKDSLFALGVKTPGSPRSSNL